MAITALALLAAAPAVAHLPPSLDQTRIETCAPATVETATDCLQSALSAADAATLTGSPVGGWRGHIDRVLIAAWRLDDAEAPLVRHMRGRDLYLSAQTSAGIVISNLSARLRGRTLDWTAVADALRRPAVERVAPVTPTQRQPDGD